MHDSVMTFVGEVVETYGLNDDTFQVLEVGSYNVNGSVRPLFDQVEVYIGTDMRAGPGVDRVVNANDLPPIFDRRFDVVVCTEMLEHDPAFWLSMRCMGDALRPDGWLILTARGNGFPEHDYPDDLWRFMPSSMPRLLDLAGCRPMHTGTDPEQPGIFAVGRRRDGD